MTTYYTQEQINEIGAFMAGKIGENAEALKVFLQQKIDEMEPAEPTPSSPDSGGKTPTASSTGGMLLDDGREIKSKLFELTLTYDQYQYTPHGITERIIGATCLVGDNDAEGGGHSPNHIDDRYDYTFSVVSGSIGIQLRQAASKLPGKTAIVLITYLAQTK